MAKKVAIILGAGASFDLIPPGQENSILNREFRPPLTGNIFSLHRNLEPILDNYWKAYTAIGTMRNRLRKNDANVTLEGMLRTLKESKEESKIQQFRQIPLYLQHLFYEICQNYCRHPINYTTLVSETNRSDIASIAFITLNYDLFLEIALEREYGYPFNKIDQYIPDGQKWIYVKLHGSINWGRKIKASAIRNTGEPISALLDDVSKLDFDKDIEQEIEIDDSYNKRPGFARKMYPAMTVPVDNKYEFTCLPSQVEKLESFLKDCRNFLIIGVSGKDRDLLDLLHNNIPDSSSVMLIGGKQIEEAKRRFKDNIPQFRTGGWFDDGFSNFIIGGGIDQFIDSAT